MKRLAAVVAVAAVASLSGLVAAPASAASICVDYDISINGQGQAGSTCLPG